MHSVATWAIAAATIAAIVARPLRIGEWLWAALGAAVLVAAGLLSGTQAAYAARDGLDVYAFLLGMLALAELARVNGIFEWLAGVLAVRSHGNTRMLFGWLFAGAIAVTALLSNDGTILLLTPAVLAVARASNISIVPFAYAVAFVANAASFILPISNPANLVVFSPLPKLVPWLVLFAAPSAIALLVTFVVMLVLFARELRKRYEAPAGCAQLSSGGRFAFVIVCASLAIIVGAAALGWPVGYVAFALGVLCVLLAGVREPAAAALVAREAPWSVIPLVAGLFVIVRALDATGALELARTVLRHASAMPPVLGRLYAGAVVTLTDAAINNLPSGVIARYALRAHGVAPHVRHAVLVGIDLGPNLSISASLATLLWVMMLRREGIAVNPWRFLAIGAAVTLPSLALSLLALR
ncbi:MAG TPA: SLC13 family permease [Candidatus Baltobacteraceae bacterium]|nr:SLC13 family permease [Candidatus Baltobacteraceae bacterium]